MSENWGANIDTRATVALPSQPGRVSDAERTGADSATDLTDDAATDSADRAATQMGELTSRTGEESKDDTDGNGAGKDRADEDREREAPVPLTDGSTSRGPEGLTTDEIAILTRAILPSSITSAPVVPAALTVGTVGRAWRALVEAVSELLDGRDGLWALEAGAGTRPLFDLPEDAFIVGVDRDPRALETNVRLDQRISAELEDYRPLAAGFDLITSWYVLDNLDDPAPVLDRFAEWTGQDGLVVLAVPNLRSPRGILARLTGKARLRRSLTPRAMRRRFADRGFTPAFHVFFEDADQAALRRRVRLTHGWWKAAQALVRMVTLGVLDAARTDYIVVFRRAPRADEGHPADQPDGRR